MDETLNDIQSKTCILIEIEFMKQEDHIKYHQQNGY